MSEPRLARARYLIRSDLERRTSGKINCPLGVFPCDDDVLLEEGFEARYQTREEAIAGANAIDKELAESDIEDVEFSESTVAEQYEYRLLLSVERVQPIMRRLFVELMPDEVHALYEEFSFDAFRETDAYMSEEPVARARFLKAWDTYGAFFVEDGKCGFGAISFDPFIEVFLEEHGAIFLACDMAFKSRVETAIARLKLKELEPWRGVENFRHSHRDILISNADDAELMDEDDIKFSVIESLSMKPSNLHEGEPDKLPTPYWVHVEVDLSFASASATGACATFAVTASSHDDALAQVETRVIETPGALMTRVLECYRMAEEDLADDIMPGEPGVIQESGIWYESGLQYWV